MYLENFVTYDEVEIYPGAHMNMVMGPNGTGKSSIVAAMAIGLGWHPNVLGRSKEVTEFIKYNTDRCVIEVVLRVEPEVNAIQLATDEGCGVQEEFNWEVFEMNGRPDDGFVCLRRELRRGMASSTDDQTKGQQRRSGNQSEWRVNGRVTQYRNVQALVRWLNIQIDNLCQFLPQDRVSEFARMSPTELLMETEKAAASPEIVAAHGKLIELQGVVRQDQVKLDSAEAALDSLQKQSRVLQETVERHRNYEEHLKMIRWCEAKRPWLAYNAARETYLKRKEVRDVAKKNLEQATSEVEPLRAQLAELVPKLKGFETTNKAARRTLENKKKAVTDLKDKFSRDLADKIKNVRNEIGNIRTRKAKIMAQMATLRQEIRDLEEAAKQDSSELEKERAHLNGQVNGKQQQIGELDQTLHQYDSEMRALSRQAEAKSTDVDAANSELQAMNDLKNRRLRVLASKNNNAAKAYDWLQQNRNQFRVPILGPICMEVNSSDPRYAKMVENTIGYGIMNSFVTIDDEVSEEFLNTLQRDHGIRVSMIVVDPRAAADVLRNRPRLHPDLVAAGFDGMAIDFIEAPEVIKFALLDSAKIHTVPIALNGLRRPIESLSSEALHGVRKLISPDFRYEVNVSRYTNERIIKSLHLRHPDFVHINVDEGQKQQILDRITAIRASQNEIQERLKAVLVRQEPVRKMFDEAKAEKSQLEDLRSKVIGKLAEFRRSALKLTSSKNKLKDLGEALAELNEEPLKAQLVKLFGARKQAILTASKALLDFQETLAKVMESELMNSIYTAEYQRLQARVDEITSRHEALKASLDAAELELTRSKAHAKALLETANEHPVDEALKVSDISALFLLILV